MHYFSYTKTDYIKKINVLKIPFSKLIRLKINIIIINYKNS